MASRGHDPHRNDGLEVAVPVSEAGTVPVGVRPQ